MLDAIRQRAAKIMGERQLQTLEDDGLYIVPKAIMHEFRTMQQEQIMIIEGKAFVVKPVEASDLDRVCKGYECMD